MKTIKHRWDDRDTIPLNTYTGKVEWEDGDVCYYKDGVFHREDGPALIYGKGEERPDGSALEYYYVNGVNYDKDEFEAKYTPDVVVARAQAEMEKREKLFKSLAADLMGEW